jgi:hypothetical protein
MKSRKRDPDCPGWAMAGSRNQRRRSSGKYFVSFNQRGPE